MELKPNKEVLSTLDTLATAAARQATTVKKTEKAKNRWQEQLNGLVGLRGKMELPRHGGYGRSNATDEPWVDIRADDKTGTTLQARRRYSHQERSHDIDYPMDEETTHSLEIRFAQTTQPEVATEPVVLASINHYPVHTSLYIRAELGLEAGSICLSRGAGYNDGPVPVVDERVMAQALEIEHEILDVLIANQQPKS